MNAVLQHAAVDPEFRAAVNDNPANFGVNANEINEITSVEQPNQESINFLTEGISNLELVACVQSCSYGPITAICDGNTK